MTWQIALRLGRVSNLPTVSSNVLAAVALAGGSPSPLYLALLCVALSAFYVGGMFLNDAFDRDIDQVERPERPIPSGQIDAATVFMAGFGLLLAGVTLIVGIALVGGCGWRPVVSALILAATIVAYDLHHKGNPFSPLVMGLCRAGVYTTAALTVRPELSPMVIAGASVLIAYLIGLTYVARQENLRELGNLWPLAFLAVPFVIIRPHGTVALALEIALALWVIRCVRLLLGEPRRIKDCVIGLIAGISLLDALWIATTGHPALALVAVGCFLLTNFLQRFVPGT